MKKGKFAIILLIVAVFTLHDLHHNTVDVPMEELTAQVETFMAHKENWLSYYLRFADKMAVLTEGLLKNFGFEIDESLDTTKNTTSVFDEAIKETIEVVGSEFIEEVETSLVELATNNDELSEVQLVHVVDGDTLIINDGRTDIKVRMIGIDTPESVHEDASKNNIYGSMASGYTKSLLNDVSSVYLQYDVEKTDDYGRTLAYVWTSSDVDVSNKDDIANYMVNAVLLKDGYAYSKAYAPNTTYTDIFTSLCADAATNNTGLWNYTEFADLWK